MYLVHDQSYFLPNKQYIHLVMVLLHIDNYLYNNDCLDPFKFNQIRFEKMFKKFTSYKTTKFHKNKHKKQKNNQKSKKTQVRKQLRLTQISFVCFARIKFLLRRAKLTRVSRSNFATRFWDEIRNFTKILKNCAFCG